MLNIYHNYCSNNKFPAVARFVTIYIDEAHAHDEWWLPDMPGAHVGGKSYIANHRNITDRLAAATKFVEDFAFPCEVVCDSFEDEVNDRFGVCPERLYDIHHPEGCGGVPGRGGSVRVQAV
jgi:hypothetical protein